MTNAITKQPKKKSDIVLNKPEKISHILWRFQVFIQFITTNCIWRAWAHDLSNLWDAIRGPSKTKASKSTGATLEVSAGESLLFQQMEQISGNAVFLSPLRVSWCSKVRWMWSAGVSKRIIRWNLSSDVSEPGQSAVWKNHYTQADILDNFGGNRPLGTRNGSLCDQNALEWNTSSSQRSAG